MTEPFNKNNKTVVKKKTVKEQILDVLPVILELLLLLFQVFFYIGESFYRLINPVKPKPVKEDLVLVTGTGHGIGRELALLYAAEGCTVVCWDINEKNNANTAAEIVKNGGPKPYIYQCDVSNRDEVLRTAKKVKEDVGEVTILINNAGIMPAHPLEDHKPEEIRKIIDINLLAHFWTIEAFLPDMKKSNHGHIVALSSMAGLCGVENLVPYCASKFGVRGLMETLSEELRLNKNNRIKTTTIFPYMVDTGLCKNPVVKFKDYMPLLEPQMVAKHIMDAQRTDLLEVTVPKYLYTINNYTRLLPLKAILKVKDFFSTGVMPD